jgi:hypothetical protein
MLREASPGFGEGAVRARPRGDADDWEDAVVKWAGAVVAFMVVLVVAFAGSPASATVPATTHCSKSVKKAHHGKCPAPKSTTTTAPTTTTSTANFDSCSVVTQADAANAIGESVTAGVLGHATVEGGLACVFYGPSAPMPTNPDVGQADTVRVVVVKGADATTWYDDYKSKVTPQAISGYGDQAYFDGVASLSVLKGDSYLRVAVAPAGAPPSLADEERLAAGILPKL